MEFLEYLTTAFDETPLGQRIATACCVFYGVYILLTASIFTKTSRAASFALMGIILYGLAAAPWTTVLSGFICVLLYGSYAKMVFHTWEEHFAGQRVKRSEKKSESNKQMPDIVKLEQNKGRILTNARHHENFDGCDLLHHVNDIARVRKENKQFRRRAERFATVTAEGVGKIIKAGMESGSLSLEQAEELNMDHIYVKFLDFLWAYTFLGPFSYLLWARKTAVLRFRKWLQRIGLIDPSSKCDYDALAAALCLEQTQAIHYYAKKQVGDQIIAGFFFADFPYVDNNCKFRVADLFAVDIDLKTKRFIKAKLDDEELTAKEAVTLLWYNSIAAQHVKLHAMANWGVNLDDSLNETNHFLRQNSVCTVIYNFFGYACFSGFFKIWHKQGLLSKGWTDLQNPFVQSINRGIKDNIWQHGQIEDLSKYSRFVKFTISCRSIFLTEFQKHKALFPGVNGEAMFVGTVLHSLDHTLLDWNLKDPLFLDTNDNKFGKMAEIGQIVKAGFVSDVDGLYFNKSFKGSSHPFYKTVYEKAAKIDKGLADHMDTCIIK